MTIKIHISRDFSFAEFDADFDPKTGDGLPSNEELSRIYDMLPAKSAGGDAPDGKTPPRSSGRTSDQRRCGNKDTMATANQRRVLERYGEWEEGMTRSEASKILSELGF